MDGVSATRIHAGHPSSRAPESLADVPGVPPGYCPENEHQFIFEW